MPCGKGAFVKDGECRRCLLGTYQDTVGQTACKSCPDGQTTIGEGSESIQDCTGRLNIQIVSSVLTILS